jgi:tetratricopeptide (TPR) repeat protein
VKRVRLDSRVEQEEQPQRPRCHVGDRHPAVDPAGKRLLCVVQHGDRHGLAQALVHAGAALWYLGRLREEMRGQAITLNNIGTVQHHQGLHRDAMRSYQASHDIFREIGGRQSLAIADHNLARLQQYKGNYASAIAIYRDVLTIYRRLGDLQHEAYAHADIGTAYRCDGLFDEAMAHYEKAASAAGKAADRYARAEARLQTLDVNDR